VIHISAAFDSGNIDVLDLHAPDGVHLAIRPDAGGEHMQWFHFRVAGARGKALTLRIVNADKVSYPHDWEGYRACASTDRRRWGRVETALEGKHLVIRHTPDADVVWFAYFAPYSLERHQDLLAEAQQSPLASVDRLGTTLDGRDLDRIVVGDGPRVIWAIARQHPGESMAEWWMEGFIRRVLDPADALSRQLREKATLHIVPNMNPDGSIRGHLRCNASGANLNREWHEPTLERSPEVFHVLAAMDASGVDLCLDVHGDEALPYNFISGCEGVPCFDERLRSLSQRFGDAYERVNPDFQQVHGYSIDKPGQANMTMCTNAVAQRFVCPGLTLEMPFKDNANLPDQGHGWCPRRCRLLGRSAVDAMAQVVDDLR